MVSLRIKTQIKKNENWIQFRMCFLIILLNKVSRDRTVRTAHEFTFKIDRYIHRLWTWSSTSNHQQNKTTSMTMTMTTSQTFEIRMSLRRFERALWNNSPHASWKEVASTACLSYDVCFVIGVRVCCSSIHCGSGIREKTETEQKNKNKTQPYIHTVHRVNFPLISFFFALSTPN